SCSKEFPNKATIKFRGWVSGSTHTLENGRCPILNESNSNVVRDSQYLYYFEEGQLVRKATNATTSDPATPLTNAPSLANSTHNESLALDDAGRIYWSTYKNGTITIWRMKADNSEAP